MSIFDLNQTQIVVTEYSYICVFLYDAVTHVWGCKDSRTRFNHKFNFRYSQVQKLFGTNMKVLYCGSKNTTGETSMRGNYIYSFEGKKPRKN